ncbi:hypothetical protein MKJ01_01910 [Chryseobacterium sp. SSA4.19]|uniref:DUF6625 family protein n=1 Tax=Chryseobacterium sp. SSA4.19 TaxID=2919915 RepID=UPI001F4DA0FF|nr:DUF6625 family protein [Chryseobacterium sp. SSA4.19]MCJ8152513.1 hypothetical protein [Chryseobacterium sp. SSA4.19]
MTKIALINCYFGEKWPSYFSYFLISCKYNPDVDFFIFTNLNAPFVIPNVHFIKINSLAEFSKIASVKLQLAINVLDSYKLCDFKPAYGLIFQDYLKDFDFWGYCDIDIILGNIRSFLTEKVLSRYDVISPVKNYPAGFFTLLRNNEQCINLFKMSKDYGNVLNSTRHFCFDECNFEFKRIYNTDILEIETEIESFALVLRRMEIEDKIRYYHKNLAQEFIYTDTVHYWAQGHIFNRVTEKKYLLIHLINLKDNKSFFIDKFKNQDYFLISDKGIQYKQNNYFHAIKKVKFRIKKEMNITYYKLLLFKYFILSYSKNENIDFLEEQSYKIGRSTITIYPQNKNEMVIVNEEDNIMQYNKFKLYKVKNNKWIGTNSKKNISTLDFHYKDNEKIPYKISIKNIENRTNETAYYKS